MTSALLHLRLFPLQGEGCTEPSAFCSNEGHVLVKEICFIHYRTTCYYFVPHLVAVESFFCLKGQVATCTLKILWMLGDFWRLKLLNVAREVASHSIVTLSRSHLPKHNPHYYWRQRGQDIPPCVYLNSWIMIDENWALSLTIYNNLTIESLWK